MCYSVDEKPRGELQHKPAGKIKKCFKQIARRCRGGAGAGEQGIKEGWERGKEKS